MICNTWVIFSTMLGTAAFLGSASPTTRDVADGALGGYLNSCRSKYLYSVDSHACLELRKPQQQYSQSTFAANITFSSY